MKAVLEQVETMETSEAKSSCQQQTVARLYNIIKRYPNGVVALDGLSLSLGQGEIVALLGPNGAGKSTAVKLMMGLSSPTSGEVRVFETDPRHITARLRTGVMLQVGRAPETLRVREHLELFRGYYSRPMPYVELIKAAGLDGLESRLFGQLSGGQKQRVLFALAIAGDPDLVFLDEPTVGLDIEARRGMWAQVRALRARGKTILLTTHYLEEADALADRIVVINKGRVVCEGTPEQVKSMGASISANGSSYGTATSGHMMQGVKIIRCITTLSAEHLLAMPDVRRVEAAGSLTVITSTKAEATLREMFALDRDLSSLEVQSPALEDAFLALTSDSR